VIRGRILRADTTAPIARAMVTISSPALIETRTATTDERGGYQFADLPAGLYTVRAMRNGFVTMSYGQRSATNRTTSQIDLADAQTMTADVSLPAAAVIEGRLFDEYGDPVAAATVQSMRRRVQNGARVLVGDGVTSMTDDFGRFRIYGLAAGVHYLGVAPATPAGGTPRPVPTIEGATAALRTYYPGTSSDAQAQPITLAAGQEAAGISFQLASAKLATVRGTVRSGSGRQGLSGWMGLASPAGVNRSNPLRTDGSFSFRDLPPGDYTVSYLDPSEAASVPVTLNASDVDLAVVTHRVATIKGRLVFEPVLPQGLAPSALSLRLLPANQAVLRSPILQATIKDDATFELPGGVGDASFVASVTSPVGPWRVKAVTIKGMDVTDTLLNLENDTDDLEVRLTQRVNVLSGRLTASDGAPVINALVVIFSEDPQKLIVPRSRYIAASPVNSTGQYTVRNLPPGRYLAIASDFLEPGDEQDPEILETLRRKATPLTLGEGETRTLDLSLAD
jgi:hypothetical protein